eukprot:gene4061-8075_t
MARLANMVSLLSLEANIHALIRPSEIGLRQWRRHSIGFSFQLAIIMYRRTSLTMIMPQAQR